MGLITFISPLFFWYLFNFPLQPFEETKRNTTRTAAFLHRHGEPHSSCTAQLDPCSLHTLHPANIRFAITLHLVISMLLCRACRAVLCCAVPCRDWPITDAQRLNYLQMDMQVLHARSKHAYSISQQQVYPPPPKKKEREKKGEKVPKQLTS